jgi:integrase/recombinase XerD
MAKRKPRRLPHIPPWDDVLRLLRATDRQRDRLIMMLWAFLGLRVSEVCKLDVDHLDFRRRLLTVRDGKGGKDRAVPLPEFMAGPLRGWCGARKAGPVFTSRQGGGEMTTRALRYLIKRIAVKAGFADATAPRRWHPHALRHAAASRWLEEGASVVEVRDILGHSSIAVTDRYSHANPQRLARVVNR